MLALHGRLAVVLLTELFFSRDILSQIYEGDACTDSSGNSGVCKPLHNCEVVIQSLDSGYELYICGTPTEIPVVCCPTEKNITLEKQSNGKSQQKCMEFTKAALRKDHTSSSSSYAEEIPPPPVIGGYASEAAEFPHMAALGYGEENDIAWLCGGSLISERFVLTAAHCLAARGRGLVQWVRLGDLNLRHTDDGVETQQYLAEYLYRHPDYVPPARYNDIALLKLDRDVIFTTFVRPACLHAQETLPNTMPQAIGWGLTEWGTSKLSDHLQKVVLNFIDIEYCNKTYALLAGSEKLSRGIDEQSMLCVGDFEGGKDTCQGDSGGPLHVHLENSPIMFDIVGITSFGIACGSKNVPAIYTRVSHFVPWIESIVWP